MQAQQGEPGCAQNDFEKIEKAMKTAPEVEDEVATFWLASNILQSLEPFISKKNREQVHEQIVKCINRGVNLTGFGEACAVADDACICPAGWKVAGAIQDNTAIKYVKLPICTRCGNPVCEACSSMSEGKRICNECKAEARE
jgi:hypothetical protein